MIKSLGDGGEVTYAWRKKRVSVRWIWPDSGCLKGAVIPTIGRP